jgi:hypothetical protein
MSQPSLRLKLEPGRFSVHRFAPEVEIPAQVYSAKFLAIVHTAEELSIVVPQEIVLFGQRVEEDWRLLQVVGPLDFSLTGVLAGLAAPLAAAQIPIFAISTFDTDYLLVKQAQIEAAVEVLQSSGYIVDNRG